MDQSTRSALSGLDWAIEQSYIEPKTEDEFSVEDFNKKMLIKDKGYSINKAKHRLRQLENQGVIKSRLIPAGNHKIRVYQVI